MAYRCQHSRKSNFATEPCQILASMASDRANLRSGRLQSTLKKGPAPLCCRILLGLLQELRTLLSDLFRE